MKLSDLKTVLMPRRSLLIKLDPDDKCDAAEMRELIRPYADQYRRVVLRDQIPIGMDVKEALKVYRNFKLLRAAPSWGDVPVSCNCKTCFPHCVCADSLLLVSLFDPMVKVPDAYVAATVSARKKCRMGGLAGRRKYRMLHEAKDNEKVVHSKAQLLAETPARSAAGASVCLVIPDPVVPPTDDEEGDADEDENEEGDEDKVCML
jgi:hypothetical protein